MKKSFVLLLAVVVMTMTACSDLQMNDDGTGVVSGYKSDKITSAYVLTDEGIKHTIDGDELKMFKEALHGGYHVLTPNEDNVYHETSVELTNYRHHDYTGIIQPYYWGTMNGGSKISHNKEYKEYLQQLKDAPEVWDFSTAKYRIVSFDKDMKPVDIGNFRFDEYTNVFYHSYVVDTRDVLDFVSNIDLDGDVKDLSTAKLSEDMLPEEEKFNPDLEIVRKLTYEDISDENGDLLSDEEIEKIKERLANTPVTYDENGNVVYVEEKKTYGEEQSN